MGGVRTTLDKIGSSERWRRKMAVKKKKVNLPIGQCQSEGYFEKWTKKGMIVGDGHK
jgi:hypothetical protein